MTDPRDLVAGQIDYYRARAPEYDQWFLRQGRYDRGPEFRARWFAEVDAVRAALAGSGIGGRVLELAAGTGLWTERLLLQAEHVTAVDASPEVLALNRARTGTERVTHVLADCLSWEPPERYDAVFMGFWLSHVPPERFEIFWREVVARALVPGGRVFFVDSRYDPTSTARDHVLEGENATSVTRVLEDGRRFRIVKVFYRPQELEARCRGLGFAIPVRETASFFIYGSGIRSAGAG